MYTRMHASRSGRAV